MTVPRLRCKAPKAKRKARVNLESDQESYESDGELEKKGCPFDDSERVDESYFQRMPDPAWEDVRPPGEFSWLLKPTENENTGLRGMSPSDFKKLTPFQALCLFIPVDWYENVAKESNNYAREMNYKKEPKITNKEVLDFHALVLAMAVSPLDNKEEFWWTEEYLVLKYPNLGRYYNFLFCFLFSLFLSHSHSSYLHYVVE
jgi:hypothetical protein